MMKIIVMKESDGALIKTSSKNTKQIIELANPFLALQKVEN